MTDKTNLVLDGFLTEAENYLSSTDFKTRSTGALDTLIDAIKIAEDDQDPGNKITPEEEKRIRKFAERLPIALSVQLPSLTSTNIAGYLASLQHRADELHNRTGRVHRVEDLYKQTVTFSSFFKSKWNKIENLKKEISALSKIDEKSFSPQRAIEVLKEIEELLDEYGSMAQYHQYSNDLLLFRKLGEKYFSQSEEFKSRSLLLDSDYKNLVLRLQKNSTFAHESEMKKQWLDDIFLELPKRTITPDEKEEYIKLSVGEAELKTKTLAKVKEVESKKHYPILLSNFNNTVEEGEFKTNALSKYEKKDGKIYIPASEVFDFTQTCKNRNLRNQIWKNYSKDLKQAIHSITFELLLTRARRADILGWQNFAEYRLKTSALGNIKNVREGLTRISGIYKPDAEKEIADLIGQSSRDHLLLDTADFNYHLAHRPEAPKAKILESERPEYRKVHQVFQKEMLPLMRDKISDIKEVAIEEFKKDMPDIPLWTSSKYLRFYKFYDSSNQFIGYQINDPFERENKFQNNSNWNINRLTPNKKFLMIISTRFDLKGKDPTGDFFLDSDSFKTTLHENGHGIYNILRDRFSQLTPDGGEGPSLATEAFFGLNRGFLKKILSANIAEIVYQEGSQAVSNPVMFYERDEFAIRNINYHSFSYKELKTLGNMDAIDSKIHGDRKRYSLFRPENPDEDSFTNAKFMFYTGKADLHRYIIFNHLQKKLVEIFEKVGYDNTQLRTLLIDYFIVPDAQRSRQPLFDRIDEFERKAMKSRGQN